MTKRITADILIDKEPHQIYFFISDLLNLPVWSDVSAVEKVSGNGEVGTIYYFISSGFFGKRKTEIEITRKSAHEHFAFKNNSVRGANESGFELHAENGSPRASVDARRGEAGKTRVTAYEETSGLFSSPSTDTKRKLAEMLRLLKTVFDN